jgi:heme/copper-type cytochrome/quinol oxidase subunit 1
MKKAARIVLSLISSTALVVVFSWWYMIHHFRTTEMTDQNLGLFMWSVIGASALAIVGLTALCYRMVR